MPDICTTSTETKWCQYSLGDKGNKLACRKSLPAFWNVIWDIIFICLFKSFFGTYFDIAWGEMCLFVMAFGCLFSCWFHLMQTIRLYKCIWKWEMFVWICAMLNEKSVNLFEGYCVCGMNSIIWMFKRRKQKNRTE